MSRSVLIVNVQLVDYLNITCGEIEFNSGYKLIVSGIENNCG